MDVNGRRGSGIRDNALGRSQLRLRSLGGCKMVGRQRSAGAVIWGELAVTDDDGEGGGMSSRVVVGKKREMVGQFRVCAITSQQCWLLIGWSFFPSNHVALWELFTQSYFLIQTYFIPRDEFSGYT